MPIVGGMGRGGDGSAEGGKDRGASRELAEVGRPGGEWGGVDGVNPESNVVVAIAPAGEDDLRASLKIGLVIVEEICRDVDGRRVLSLEELDGFEGAGD